MNYEDKQHGQGYTPNYKNPITALRDNRGPKLPPEVIEARLRVEAVKRARRVLTVRKLTDLTIGTVF
jgi:hypothetical protein